ncbi:MAG: hypothetical protein FJW14_05660 [Acidimicrobiia bacterium]|nr:hypothetical protein [Acidimicrobiia bacterium]
MISRVILCAAVLALPATAAAQDYEPWLGEWRLNVEQSAYSPGPPPYTRAMFTIERLGGGVRVIYEMVRPRGGVIHMEWDGAFDGREYPVQGLEEHVTYAYTRIDDRTYDIVARMDGRVAASSRTAVAPDGRTITTITVGRDAQGREAKTVTVYEKVEK